MHELLLVLHIAAGTVGLVAGPVAGVARKSRGLHTLAGWTYQICCAALCLSALALVAMSPRLWPFAFIAVPTQVAAAAAVVVRRRHRPGWRPLNVQLVLGSYVSFVTALVVQAAGGWWLVLPVVLGSSGVALVTARVAAGGVRGGVPPGAPGGAGALCRAVGAGRGAAAPGGAGAAAGAGGGLTFIPAARDRGIAMWTSWSRFTRARRWFSPR